MTPLPLFSQKSLLFSININILIWMYFFYLTPILLRLFQQQYCYNVTGQSQESKGSCMPARIKEVHSKLHSFQVSLCTLTASHLTLIYYIGTGTIFLIFFRIFFRFFSDFFTIFFSFFTAPGACQRLDIRYFIIQYFLIRYFIRGHI